MEHRDNPPDESFLAMARRHPVITWLMIACTVGGALAGWVWLSPEWSDLKRLAAGAVAGAGCGLMVAAPRMVGPWRDGSEG